MRGSMWLIPWMVGCPAPDDPVEADPIELVDAQFEPAIAVGRPGDALTLRFEARDDAGSLVDPVAFRVDGPDLGEPVRVDTGIYEVTTGGTHTGAVGLGMYGCDPESPEPCLPSGFVTGIVIHAGAPSASIALPAVSIELGVGEVRPWTATPLDAEGSPSHAPLGFTSRDAAVLSVEGHVLTGVAPGSTTLTLQADDVSVDVPVTVAAATLGPPGEGEWQLVPGRTRFDESLHRASEVQGHLASQPAGPVAVWRNGERDGMIWLATWTGTGFGYERIQQNPLDQSAYAKVRVEPDGRIVVLYEAAMPAGLVAASREGAPGAPWSFEYLLPDVPVAAPARREHWFHDAMIDGDGMWVVSRRDEGPSAKADKECMRVVDLHRLVDGAVVSRVEVFRAQCLATEVDDIASLQLLDDPLADVPIVVVNLGITGGQVHAYRYDGYGWWPEYWAGHEGPFEPNTSTRFPPTHSTVLRSGDDTESWGMAWMASDQYSRYWSVFSESTATLSQDLPYFGDFHRDESQPWTQIYGTTTRGHALYGVRELARLTMRRPDGSIDALDPWPVVTTVPPNDNEVSDSVYGIAAQDGWLYATVEVIRGNDTALVFVALHPDTLGTLP